MGVVRCRASTYIPVYLHLGPSAHHILQDRLEYPHGYSSLYILMFRTIQSWQPLSCTVLPTCTSISPSSSPSAMVALWKSHGSQRYVMHIPQASHSLQKLWHLGHPGELCCVSAVISHYSGSVGVERVPLVSLGTLSLFTQMWAVTQRMRQWGNSPSGHE